MAFDSFLEFEKIHQINPMSFYLTEPLLARQF